MTITEHLQFSVLSAPVAQVDRRGLSEAWYSALYGGEKRQSAAAPARSPQIRDMRGERPEMPAGKEPAGSSVRTPKNAASAVREEKGSGPVAVERRTARSPLARKIERAFLHPAARVRNASFELEGMHGRVQVLLRGGGNRVKLVAVCASSARGHVAAALAQARYALARRGIELDASTVERAC